MLALSSCEAFISARGTICDKQTGKPLDGVTVELLWRHSRDTMQYCGIVQDTLPRNERRRLRRQGVKDDYKSFDFGANGWGRRSLVVSDTAGKFHTATFWVSAIFGVPKVSLYLLKPGYKPMVVNDRGGYAPVIFLERAE